MKQIIFLLLLFLVDCSNYPVQFNDQKVADCSTPTKPRFPIIDTTKTAAVIEIYDFEQKLINYDETDNVLVSWPGTLDSMEISIYWNGNDMKGDPVDPGKYLVKLSTFHNKEEHCSCSNIFIER